MVKFVLLNHFYFSLNANRVFLSLTNPFIPSILLSRISPKISKSSLCASNRYLKNKPPRTANFLVRGGGFSVRRFFAFFKKIYPIPSHPMAYPAFQNSGYFMIIPAIFHNFGMLLVGIQQVINLNEVRSVFIKIAEPMQILALPNQPVGEKWVIAVFPEL